MEMQDLRNQLEETERIKDNVINIQKGELVQLRNQLKDKNEVLKFYESFEFYKVLFTSPNIIYGDKSLFEFLNVSEDEKNYILGCYRKTFQTN